MQTLALLEERFGGDPSEGEILAGSGAYAADNALDCALWDLRAKRAGSPVWTLVKLPAPASQITAYTLGIDSPAAMGARARDAADRALLKIKLGGEDAGRDGDRLKAVRDGAPESMLIVDANEGWTPALLETHLEVAAACAVAMIEQPLPAGADAALRGLGSPVPIGADESVHGLEDLEALRDRYQVLNVKLDKTGGLTRALALTGAAGALGFDLMIGCMVATSLSMAPALLLAHGARFVDLDGPLLLREDRPDGLAYEGSEVAWPERCCWGSGISPGIG
jgi:L-alanine-DL-glutamate epimerase-like enolase superfamily enzyme